MGNTNGKSQPEILREVESTLSTRNTEKDPHKRAYELLTLADNIMGESPLRELPDIPASRAKVVGRMQELLNAGGINLLQEISLQLGIESDETNDDPELRKTLAETADMVHQTYEDTRHAIQERKQGKLNANAVYTGNDLYGTDWTGGK